MPFLLKYLLTLTVHNKLFPEDKSEKSVYCGTKSIVYWENCWSWKYVTDVLLIPEWGHIY